MLQSLTVSEFSETSVRLGRGESICPHMLNISRFYKLERFISSSACILNYTLVVTCPAYQLDNGQVRYNKNTFNGNYPYDTRVTLSCGYDYILSGPSSACCVDPGNWDQQSRCTAGNILNVVLWDLQF